MIRATVTCADPNIQESARGADFGFARLNCSLNFYTIILTQAHVGEPTRDYGVIVGNDVP